MKQRLYYLAAVIVVLIMWSSSAIAIDSEITRKTLVDIRGIHVFVENIQPNIEKYASRFKITKEQIQQDVEQRLKNASIVVLSYNDWLKTAGRPMLYVNVNTHEYEKYWYSYTISLAVQQGVMLETNPKIKTIATTWSIEMTGIANIGTLDSIKTNTAYLVDRFINAYRSVR